MIIGFCGQKGAGKDTAGDYLVKKYEFERLSFAAKLKESAAALFGINSSIWEDLKNKEDARVILEVGYSNQNMISGQELSNISVREFLQRYGTESHRDIFGFNFWVDQAFRNIDLTKNWVITDVRFANEAIAVHEHKGKVIQITRNGSVKDSHASEAGLPEPLIDGKIANNGSIKQLHLLLDTLMERLNG